MAPRKLSDQDKQDVAELYKQANETTSTIAERYGVSNSTISRILKTLIPEDEYSQLISQKRQGGSVTTSSSSSSNQASSTVDDAPESDTSASKPKRLVKKRTRIRSSAQGEAQGELEMPVTPTDPDDDADVASEVSVAQSSVETSDKPAPPRRRVRRRANVDDDEQTQLPLLDSDTGDDAPVRVVKPKPADPDIDFDDVAEESPLVEDVDYDELDAEVDDIDDDIDDDDEFDDEFDDDDAVEGDEDFAEPHLAPAVQIVPLSEATLPRTCYLVIDRLSELITRPLSDFADLGQLPSSEGQARTLPIFDNHRVARRFSRRNQRVIKVPNGQLLTKTRPYLQAKGISHLLIDGNVYSLVGDAGELV